MNSPASLHTLLTHKIISRSHQSFIPIFRLLANSYDVKDSGTRHLYMMEMVCATGIRRKKSSLLAEKILGAFMEEARLVLSLEMHILVSVSAAMTYSWWNLTRTMYMEEHGQDTPMTEKWSLEFTEKREKQVVLTLAWVISEATSKISTWVHFASYGQIVHQSLSPSGTASGELGRTVQSSVFGTHL